MSTTPSALAQSIAQAAANLMADLPTPVTSWQTAIAGGALTPAAIFDALRTFTAYVEIGSGGGAPAFSNSWVNFGGSSSTAAYLIDALGFVHLKGTIKSGTINATAFTLPAGFRPASTLIFPSISNGALGAVNVVSTGAVVPTVGTNVYIGLDGITFKAEV